MKCSFRKCISFFILSFNRLFLILSEIAGFLLLVYSFYSPSGLFVEICKKNTFGSKKIGEKFVISKINRTFASLLKIKPSQKEVWRDGRVVDYSGLENRRAERHRGFESLSLRSIKVFS